MTRLLVSVRNAEEATEAVAAGADLVDLKEPARGSLGAVESRLIRDVVRRLVGQVPLSVALGELLDFDPSLATDLPYGLAFAKFGLAGCASVTNWPDRLAAAWGFLPPDVGQVAVIYADWSAAAAPPPRVVLKHAAALGCRAALIDTCIKDGRGLLDHWSLAELADCTERARAADLLVVVAGALNPASVARILPLSPDFVAVRGAVCRGDRSGRLDARLVGRLVAQIREFSRSPRAGGLTAGPAAHFC